MIVRIEGLMARRFDLDPESAMWGIEEADPVWVSQDRKNLDAIWVYRPGGIGAGRFKPLIEVVSDRSSMGWRNRIVEIREGFRTYHRESDLPEWVRNLADLIEE